MEKYIGEILRDETGNFTLEAAFIVPIIVSLICVLLLANILTFKNACQELAVIKMQNAAVAREPGEVIRNTDLGFEYLERLQFAMEEDT